MMRKKHDREVGTPHPIPPSLAAILSSFMEGSSTCWFISFARHQPVAKEQLEAHSKENSPRDCSNHGRQLVLVIQEHMSAEVQPWSRAESPSTVAAHKAAAGRCNINEKKLASGLRRCWSPGGTQLQVSVFQSSLDHFWLIPSQLILQDRDYSAHHSTTLTQESWKKDRRWVKAQQPHRCWEGGHTDTPENELQKAR